MATAKETCKSVPKSYLDHVISDIHIAQLAKSVTEWQELAPFLGLSPAEEKEIVEQCSGRLKIQTREALRKWSTVWTVFPSVTTSNSSLIPYDHIPTLFLYHSHVLMLLGLVIL